MSLPSHLVSALNQLAREREQSVDHLVRGMLDREVTRLRTARASHRMRAERHARLHTLLNPVINAALGWRDLQARLALIGYELRLKGQTIALYDCATGEWISRGTDIGIAYPHLVHRFGGPLPERLRAMQHPQTKKAAGAEPDDLMDLLEPS